MRAPFFVTAAAGTADLLASELVALGIEGAREVLGGVACEGEARGRLPRLPRIATWPARAVAARTFPGDGCGFALRGRARHRLEHSARRRCDAGRGFLGQRAGRHAHAVRRAARERRRRGPVPREDWRATVRGPRLADASHQCPCGARGAHDRDRPLRRKPAPARLSRRAGCRAAQGEPRRRHSRARRLARDRGARAARLSIRCAARGPFRSRRP